MKNLSIKRLGALVCAVVVCIVALFSFSALAVASDIPAMPQGGQDLITAVSTINGPDLGFTFTNEILQNTVSNQEGKIHFSNITGITQTDSYVYSLDVTPLTFGGNAGYEGPRVIFRYTDNDNYLSVGFFNGTVHLLKTVNASVAIVASNADYSRTAGTKVKVEILSKPTAVTILINGVKFFDNVTVPQIDAKVGMYSALATSKSENIVLYNTVASSSSSSSSSSQSNTPPTPPAGNQNLITNATTITDASAGTLGVTYSNGILLNTSSGNENSVIFNTTGLGENDTYLYEGEVTFLASGGSDAWKAPRLLFRETDGDHELSVAFFADSTHLLSLNGTGNLSIVTSSTSFIATKNTKFKITIKSEPEKVTVWINDSLIFTNVAVPKFMPNVGMHYSYATAKLENIKLISLMDGTSSTSSQSSSSSVVVDEMVSTPLSGYTAVDGGTFTFTNNVFNTALSQNESIYLFKTKTLPAKYTFKSKMKIGDIDASASWHGMKIILKYNDANSWFGVMWDINGGLLPIEMKNGAYVNHDEMSVGTTTPMAKDKEYLVEWLFDGDKFVLKIDGATKISATAPTGYKTECGIRSAMIGISISEAQFMIPKTVNGSPATKDNNLLYEVLAIFALAASLILIFGRKNTNEKSQKI